MRPTLVLSLLLFFASAACHARFGDSADVAAAAAMTDSSVRASEYDDIGSYLAVYSSIVAVYLLYWWKHKV